MSAQPQQLDVDRARLVRVAMRRLVAERGFHGASMSAVAREAGVGTGTAYVHYASKDELVLAAYAETKRELGAAATRTLDPRARPRDRFISIWLALHAHLREHTADARFLLQVEQSPYMELAHEQALAAADDPLLAAARAPDLLELLAPLPQTVLWELGLAPAVRLAVAGEALGAQDLRATAEACWRAVAGGR